MRTVVLNMRRMRQAVFCQAMPVTSLGMKRSWNTVRARLPTHPPATMPHSARMVP